MPKAKKPAKKAAKKVAAKDRAAQNAAALAALETMRDQIPWAFAENGKGDFMPEAILPVLRGLNVAPDRGARYRFDWGGSQDAFKAMYAPVAAALAPRRDLSRNFDGTRNIFIRGDNLEALKILRKAYAGRVKMIYIDPPYNTGGDFVYRDDFRDPMNQYLRETGQVDASGKPVRAAARVEERKVNGRKHSNWMSMMFPRLFTAREFLSKDGVIFISIDDNEVHHLRMLMNIIFGETNFVSQFVWRKKYGGGKGAKHIVDLHEYIVCYAKDMAQLSELRLPRTERQKEIFRLEDEHVESRGRHYTRPLKSGLASRPTLTYPIRCPDGSFVETQWICSESEYLRLLAEGRIVFKKLRSGNYNVYKKFYEFDNGDAVLPESIIYDLAYNQNGKEEIKRLFGVKEGRDVPFENAKPVDLLKHLIAMSTYESKDGIILDFFAGSATTAHAVMQMNYDDGGRRQCISVQLPEPTPEKSAARKTGFPTIADIGMERMRRAGDQIQKSDNGKMLAAEVDTGFRVFELSESVFRPWRGTEKASVESWTAEQKSALALLPKKVDAEALIAELMLEEGYPLTSPMEELKAGRNRVWRITHSDPALAEEGMMLHVCLDADVEEDLHLRLGLCSCSRLVIRGKSLTDSQAMTMGIHCSVRLI